MDIKEALATLPDHNVHWLNRYIDFLMGSPEPAALYDRHHILPQALFPAFTSFRMNPWNQINLSPSDHLLAHYYLYRALPSYREARTAFILMVGLRYSELIEKDFDEDLVKEVARAYEEARGAVGESLIKGWVHIYKTEKECSVCPPDQVEAYLAKGWKVGVPERVWVMKGVEQHRVLISEVPTYMTRGFVLGRNEYHTDKSKKAIGQASIRYHQENSTKEEGYSYLPHGDNHHRRILGISEETKAKISKALTGRKLSTEHAAKARVAGKGKSWKWSEEAKQVRSESMKGKVPTNGLTMKGKVHSEESRACMSKAHEEFYSDPDKAETLNAARPRGADHVFFGKERDADTRAKISQALEGKKQSEETKRKRSEALKEFHRRKAECQISATSL